MSTRLFRRSLPVQIFGVLIVVSGCGGGGSSSSGVGSAIYTFNNNVKASVSSSAKSSAEASLALTWGSVLGQSNAVQAKALVSAMQGLNQFRSGGISQDSTAWGVYKDGTELIFATNDPALRSLSSGNFSAAERIQPQSGEDLTTRTIPQSAQAYVLNSFETTRPNTSLSTVIGELTSFGYKVTSSNGSLSDWLTLNSAGLLIAEGPGSLGLGGSNIGYFQGVSDAVSTTTDNQYATQLGSRSLAHLEVIGIGSDGVSSYASVRYGFSAGFLSNRKGFSSGSLFLNAAPDSSADPSFRSTLASQMGLGAFVGWTGPVSNLDAQQSILFALDKALGVNQVVPIDTPTLPPVAIGSLATKLSGVNRPGLSYSFNQAKEGSAWAYTVANASSETLIPSIVSAAVGIGSNNLILQGSFGSQTGTATFNGASLTLVSWTPTAVTVVRPLQNGNIFLSESGLTSNNYSYSLPSLSLAPTSSTVAKSGSVAFTVQPPTNVSGSVIYDWSQTSASATLTSADGVVGHSIETTSTQVTLKLAPTDSGTVTIVVKAYQVDALGNRTFVGQAQAVVTVS